MGWLIPKTEEHTIGDSGTSIKIIDRTKGFGEFNKLVKKVILDASNKSSNLIQEMGPVNFILIGFLGRANNILMSSRAKVLVKTNTVLINLNNLLKDQDPKALREYVNNLDRQREYKQVYGTVIHEIFHLYHNFKTKIIVNMQAYSKRLNRYKKKVNNKHPKSVRADVGLFFHNLLIEGLAKYLQYHSSDIFKNKRNLYVLYGEAADKAHKINIFISLFMEQKKEGKVKKRLIKDLRKELYYSKYLIGEYMCERIVASGGEKTETLIKTKPLAFIRKYEAAEKKLGFTPVVSLNSKKGILDYNHALAKLAALSR